MTSTLSRLAAAILVVQLSPPADAKSREPELSTRVPAEAPAAAARPGYIDLSGGGVAYIPASIPAGSRAPLLVLLRGAQGDGREMIDRFREQADRRGIILVAPPTGGRTWDAVMDFNPIHRSMPRISTIRPADPPIPFGDDVVRVDGTISAIVRQVAVDPARIGLLGFSDGATYALALGTRNAGLFGTIIAFSPGFAFPKTSKGRQRIFLAHGMQDRVLPFPVSRRDIVPSLKRHGYDVTFVPFHGDHEMPDDIVDQAIGYFLQAPR